MSRGDDIRRRALEIGFTAVGIGPASPLVEHERILTERLARGALAGLDYFRKERVPLATRPRLLVPEARAVISLAWAYDGSQPPPPDSGAHGRVAAYARGSDYHLIIKERLEALVGYLQERVPGVACRAFVDATPILERALAVRAGLGWFGKNNCLLTLGHGSWVLLAEVLTSAELEPDPPSIGDCGDCRVCLEACPTGALAGPYSHRVATCLSYLTVECRGSIPAELRPLLGDQLLGCDTCQAACPRNATKTRFPATGSEGCARGEAGVGTLTLTLSQREREQSPEHGLPAWLELAPLFSLDEAGFRARFAGTAAARAKRAGLLRNAAVVLGNSGDRDGVPALARALLDHEPLLRGHAAWALGRLGGRAARAALEEAANSEPTAQVATEITAALAGR